MSAILMEDHLFRKVFKCLDKLDTIADSMDRHVTILEEMDKEERGKPILRRVK